MDNDDGFGIQHSEYVCVLYIVYMCNQSTQKEIENTTNRINLKIT